MGFVIAPSKALILREPDLGQVELLLINEGWNGRHEDPFIWR
jgi:hypothetical protein